MHTMVVAVAVIPTYNENENIKPLVERILSTREGMTGADLHIVFVDDSSPDGTGESIRNLSQDYSFLHLLVRDGKLGLGTAYIEGFRYALGLRPDIILQMDADLQHPPEKIPELMEAIVSGFDVAIASRYIAGGGEAGWSRGRIIVSKGANALARVVLGIGVKDATSGFRAMKSDVAQVLIDSKLSAAGFSYQVESLRVVKKQGKRITEVPFVFEKRKRGASKLTLGEVARFTWTVFAARLKY
jgi:glycosyltransferase involved in cell wall biosynthesis